MRDTSFFTQFTPDTGNNVFVQLSALKMNTNNYREIPYNFTSADDKLIINLLFGSEVWEDLEELRSQRITGRSARLVMRFMGDLFILRRNPFLYQELIDSPIRRQKFFKTAKEDLTIIEEAAKISQGRLRT